MGWNGAVSTWTPKKTSSAPGESVLSADNSRAKILVVSTNEELIVSRETARVLTKKENQN